MKFTKNAKIACNWLLSDVSAWLNANEKTIETCELKPEMLAKLVGMIEDGKISNAQAKQVVDEMMHGEDPEAVAEKKGLKQMSDTGAIKAMVKEALDENPQAIEDFKNGKGKALGFLMGQVMKKSKGQANGGIVNKLIKEELQKRIGE